MTTKRKRKPHPDTFTVTFDVQLLEKDGEYYYRPVSDRPKRFEYRIEVIPKPGLPDPPLVTQWLVGAIFKREVKE